MLHLLSLRILLLTFCLSSVLNVRRLDYYRETNIVFMGIENIHSMRDSIRKLFDLIKNEVRGNERSNWWSGLEVGHTFKLTFAYSLAILEC